MTTATATTLVRSPVGYKATIIREVITAESQLSAAKIARKVMERATAEGYSLKCWPNDVYMQRHQLGIDKVKQEVVKGKNLTMADALAISNYCEQHGGMLAIAKKLKDFVAIRDKFGSLDDFSDTLLMIAKLSNNKKVAECLESS